MEGCILAVKSHEGLETLFLAIICCDLKTASLAAPHCGTKTSFCAFNVENVERKVPRERLSRKHDRDVIKVSSSIQKSCFLLGKFSPKRASILQDPLSEKSPNSLRRSITPTSIDVLCFLPYILFRSTRFPYAKTGRI